jgi:hypothetical protein
MKLDLHNNYIFTGLYLDKIDNTAFCDFQKSTGEWVPETAINHFSLHFDKVINVFIKPHDKDYPSEYIEKDKTCIDMIGFSYDSDEIMEGVTSHIPSIELPGLLLVFVTGKSIKIIADSVQLTMTEHKPSSYLF